MTTMMASRPLTPVAASEKELRQRIDRSLSRALVDGGYAQALLADPTVALEEGGCPPQQFKLLRSIHAVDLSDFARQAEALFWIAEPHPIVRRSEVARVAASG
jgi:hypothetical protein